ncbi:TetR/AcrR family transcriptional regulator [Ornithinimicrobium cerasi]|uniref:TetR/AcrR family transcriptional regulator n=1 Tax=Ornithinimicrobium cerasi TaxID=2248773 RepID=UPI001F003289|nr:TetR/AcrR family transcriptional regulator C-terminal domain-containing protein [Ornithinimicrobium cerasi]
MAGPRSTATRTRLSRDLIVDSALRFIDTHGAQGLTMRKLGAELGVEAMALYRHVSGREDLLEAVVDHLLEGMLPSLDDDLTSTWQGYLQTLAHQVREVASEHPHAFPLVATRHPAAPWLRPPLRRLDIVEHFLATLGSKGFSDEQTVEAYQAFSSFLLGHLLLESAQQGAETGPVEEPLDEGNADIPGNDADLDLTQMPTITRLRPLLSQDKSAQEFEIALETLIDRFEMSLSQ